MPDLQEPLLAHLQREAKRNARERATIEENEPLIAPHGQKTNDAQALLHCLKRLNYEL